MKSQTTIECMQDPQKKQQRNIDIMDYHDFLKNSCDTSLQTALKFINIVPQSDPHQEFQVVELDNFNSLGCTKKKLIYAARRLMIQFIGQDKIFKNNGGYKGKLSELFENLASEICIRYNTIPYHNFTHGFQLMKFFYFALCSFPRLKQTLSKQSLVVSLFAALAHDIDHRGLNNQFYQNMNTSFVYKDEKPCKPILESMHADTFLKIMKIHPQLDILSYSELPEYNRQLAVQLILATDMAKHNNHIDLLRKIEGKQDFQNKQNQNIILKSLFHACDLNGPCHTDFQEYYSWSCLLNYEFVSQVKLQRQKKIQVSQFMAFKGELKFIQGQMFFLQNIEIPLWKQLGRIEPKLHMFVSNIENNKKKLQQKKIKHSQQQIPK